MKDSEIQKSIQKARENWRKWCEVFQYNGSERANPLLAEPARFRSFLSEYGVGRTIRAGTHEKLRCELAKSSQFSKAIHDDTGHGLDQLEKNLRGKFGTCAGKHRIISALSKVAAFVKPERFVAWDEYARKGLNRVRPRADSAKFDTYADYLAAFEAAWEGQPGKEIREYITRNGVESPVESEPRFLRRVLDVYLMMRGDRSF